MDSEVYEIAEKAEERRQVEEPYVELAAAVIREAYTCLRRALIRKNMGVLKPEEERPEVIEKFIKDLNSPYHKTLSLPDESYEMMVEKAHAEAREYAGKPPNQRRSWQNPIKGKYRKRNSKWKKSGKK